MDKLYCSTQVVSEGRKSSHSIHSNLIYMCIYIQWKYNVLYVMKNQNLLRIRACAFNLVIFAIGMSSLFFQKLSNNKFLNFV